MYELRSALFPRSGPTGRCPHRESADSSGAAQPPGRGVHDNTHFNPPPRTDHVATAVDLLCCCRRHNCVLGKFGTAEESGSDFRNVTPRISWGLHVIGPPEAPLPLEAGPGAVPRA